MDKIVIAAASYYNQNYYLNKDLHFPAKVNSEIKQLVINAAHKSKGMFSISFTKDGNIILETGGLDGDLNYDEIEGKLQINRLEVEKADLLSGLSLWLKIRSDKR